MVANSVPENSIAATQPVIVPLFAYDMPPALVELIILPWILTLDTVPSFAPQRMASMPSPRKSTILRLRTTAPTPNSRKNP